MKEFVADFMARLSSRKFLLAFGAFIAFIGVGQYFEAALVVLGYLGVEGAADALERRA
jgi:hypothetical protein